MSIANAAMAARAASMLKRWGTPAKLRRNGVLRDCIAACLDYKPSRQGEVMDQLETYLLAAPLTVPPDNELDELVFNGAVYKIIFPVKGPRPGGTALYYWLEVLYVGKP